MAATRSAAQDIITCDLCHKPTQQFCNSCQVSLCEICASKHKDDFNFRSHDIVHFLDRKEKPKLPECQVHSGQICEFSCEECIKQICRECVASGRHKGHYVEERTETQGYVTRKAKNETGKIKVKFANENQKKGREITNVSFKTKEKMDDLGKESQRLRNVWHREVDCIFDKIDSLSQYPKDRNLFALNAFQNKSINLISEMYKIIEQKEDLVNPNKLTEVNKHQSQLKGYRDFPENKDLKLFLMSSTFGQRKSRSVAMGRYTATLSQISQPSLPSDNILLTTGKQYVFHTNHIPLKGIACVGESSEAWLFGNSQTITRVDIHGTVMDTVTAKQGADGISTTKKGELLYSDRKNRTINIVRHGKSETLIKLSRGWTPGGLYCTTSGDILVHVHTESSYQTRNRIVRYQIENRKEEVNNDVQTNLIFENGPCSLFISENNNGDVCVSDLNADKVVVVDKTGRLRFRYDGTPARCKWSFSPRGIITEAMGRIIIADHNNNCLHILDQDGQFLGCLDIFDLKGPRGLSVDIDGKLWVGSAASGEIKVIEW